MKYLRKMFSKHGWRMPVFSLLFLLDYLKPICWSLRRLRLTLIARVSVGSGTTLESTISVSPRSRVIIGRQSYIGTRCQFEVSTDEGVSVQIGDRAWLSHDCHVLARGGVRIGNDALIGEFTSIRDTSHDYSDPNRPIRTQSDLVGSILIEDDVWIGRGCLILGRPEGLVIRQGAVIGANSVVLRSVPPYEVWAGVPARKIKERNSVNGTPKCFPILRTH